MKESKRILGLTVNISGGRNDGIRQLEIRIRELYVHDAAQELQESIVRGNESQQEHNLKSAHKIQQAAGETRYFTHSGFSADLTFAWQDDSERRDKWYAGHVSLDRANAECFSILSKIVKAVGHADEIGPRKLIEALRIKMGVLPVKYLPSEYVFVRDQHFDLDAEIPPFELPSEPDASAELDPEAEELLENPEAAEAA